MRESFPEIFGDNWQEAGEIYKNSYRAIHLGIQFLPNALALIDELEKMNILAFVVSNKIGLTLRKETAAIGIDKKFFAIVGSQDASYDKPDKSPVELALMGSDLDPKKDEIWFVGDTIADVECAYNSACKPIIYGAAPGEISKTIPEKLYREGKNGAGQIALYFDHQELINKLRIL
jgi:phosphoglycolate phosphatase